MPVPYTHIDAIWMFFLISLQKQIILKCAFFQLNFWINRYLCLFSPPLMCHFAEQASPHPKHKLIDK